jgi:hypothetical protein
MVCVGYPARVSTDFSSESVRARKKWYSISGMLKEQVSTENSTFPSAMKGKRHSQMKDNQKNLLIHKHSLKKEHRKSRNPDRYNRLSFYYKNHG